MLPTEVYHPDFRALIVALETRQFPLRGYLTCEL
jgi:hypothetical protein